MYGFFVVLQEALHGFYVFIKKCPRNLLYGFGDFTLRYLFILILSEESFRFAYSDAHVYFSCFMDEFCQFIASLLFMFFQATLYSAYIDTSFLCLFYMDF